MASTPPGNGPSISAVVRQTIRGLPAETRRGFRLVLLAWLAVLALQVWDSAQRPDASGAAEFSSVLLGTAGVLTLALTEALRRVEVSAPQQAAVRQILMALPPLAAGAASLLAASIALLVARIWLGTSPVILAVAPIYCGAFWLAMKAAAGAARRLFEYGQREAGRAATVEAELAGARLAALQSQMNPHFLFNALNAVAALVPTNPRAAESTIENLSHVLRMTLSRSQTATGTLADEVEFVQAYLGIEAQRFGERLAVDWNIESGASRAGLPPLAIQPLVENAIRHGIGHRRQGGRLTIRAARAGSRLKISVSDDGDGFPARHQEGTGLGNLRRRLDALFGPDASLQVVSSESGSQVSLDLPFREIQGDADARADR